MHGCVDESHLILRLGRLLKRMRQLLHHVQQAVVLQHTVQGITYGGACVWCGGVCMYGVCMYGVCMVCVYGGACVWCASKTKTGGQISPPKNQ